MPISQYWKFILLKILLICNEEVKLTKIRYDGSSVWTISPVTEKERSVVSNLEMANIGIFISIKDDDERKKKNTGFHVTKLPSLESKLLLVAPPYLERATIDILMTNGIHFEEYKDWPIHNRIFGGTDRKYVTSTGSLPLNIKIRNFKYDLPSQESLADLYEPVDLIDKITVPNNSPATVIISLSESQTMTQTWELSFTESLTGLIGGDLSINLPDMGGGGLSASAQIEFSSTQTISQSIERNYGIARQVAIPPFTTIQAHGYVNWLRDIQVPFEATGQVYLDRSTNATLNEVTMVYCDDGTATAQCSRTCGRTPCPADCVGNNTCVCCAFAVTPATAGMPNVMRDYLISQGMQAEVTGLVGNFLDLRLRGTFTASLGTDLIFNVTQILDEAKTHRQLSFAALIN